MEFWGIEVKPGETVKCDPGDDKYLHLSQASLGEVKKDNKGNESVPIYIKFNDQKLVLGTLSADKCPQISYDLVFEKEFEVSHSWKNGSVFFCGYKTLSGGPEDFVDDIDSDSEDEDTLVKKEASVLKAEAAKPKANILPKTETLTAKSNVKVEELKKAKEEEDDGNNDSDEDDSEEDESDDEDMLGGEDDSEDRDEDESSEEEATPKKADGKKRPAGSASKTPVPEKKAKLVTPVAGRKTGGGADGKKGGHTATPYPAKQIGKDRFKQQTPTPTGSVSCKSCSKTFKNDLALQAHTKAKHASK